MGVIEDQALMIKRRKRRLLKQWGICTLIHKDSTHKEPLIHVSIWIRKDAVVKEEDDEVEDSTYSCKEIKIKESTHQKNKDKWSIFISWYRLVVHLFIFSWCVMHVWVFAFILQNYTWWVRSQWCCKTFHFYLSRLKPLY